MRSNILYQIADEELRSISEAQVNPKPESLNSLAKPELLDVKGSLPAPKPKSEVSYESPTIQVGPVEIAPVNTDVMEAIRVESEPESSFVPVKESANEEGEGIVPYLSAEPLAAVAIPLPESADTQQIIEPLAKTRVTQVFEKLLALSSLDEHVAEKPVAEESEVPTAFTEDLVINLEPEPAEVVEAEPVVYMAELLDLAPERVEQLQAVEEPPRLEQIVEHAEEAQPLEETLLELAVYFDRVELEALEPAEAEMVEEIRQILQEIEQYIASPAYMTETEGKPRVTPELTRQLLELLTAVGYKDPGETLVKFVAEYDLYTLIKAIRYLHQLSQASEQQEMIARYGLAQPTAGDMPGRWGRLLLGLMMGVVLNNQLRQNEA